MAADNRKPRVRKTAPTIRERMEAAQAEPPEKKARVVRRKLSGVGAPAGRVLKPLVKPLGFIKRVLRWLVPSYFVNSWREMKLVTWPNRKETRRLTLAVFVFALVFGALVAVVDKGLDEIFKKLVLR